MTLEQIKQAKRALVILLALKAASHGYIRG